MTNKRHTTLYIGVTSDLLRRTYEHKHHLMEGFTDKYNLEDLVYFENYDRVEDAIAREKQIKKHRREKKDALVESMNPDWRDLYDGISR